MPENVIDYADRCAKRELVIGRMTGDELRAYAIGLSHAYGDVFAACTETFDQGGDLHTLGERLSAQWNTWSARVWGVPL